MKGILLRVAHRALYRLSVTSGLPLLLLSQLLTLLQTQWLPCCSATRHLYTSTLGPSHLLFPLHGIPSFSILASFLLLLKDFTQYNLL